jgi:hypothetical protein
MSDLTHDDFIALAAAEFDSAIDRNMEESMESRGFDPDNLIHQIVIRQEVIIGSFLNLMASLKMVPQSYHDHVSNIDIEGLLGPEEDTEDE